MSEALRLTGAQRKILREGIIGAYPNPDDLRILLYEQMEVQLGAIARGDTYNTRIYSLIEDFEADGRIEKLIKLIVGQKPDSPYLKELKTEFAGILSASIIENKTYDSLEGKKMKNQSSSLNPTQRLSLRRTLRELIVSDLNDLIDALQVPKGIIPPPTADPASRVDALWGWAESPTGCGLKTLQEILEAIAHPQ